MAEKTHSITTLSCGCVERRWLFGHDFLYRCFQHRWKRPEPRARQASDRA